MDKKTKYSWLVAIFFMIAAVAMTTFVATPASAQTVTTEKGDYQPGMTVKIMGSGWFPGETVSISIHEEPQPGDPDFLTSADADAGGNIVNQAFSVNNGDIGRTFTVTATSQSGATKTTTFTDGPQPPPGSLCNTPAATDCSGATSLVVHNPTHYKVLAGQSITGKIVGAT